MKIITYWRNALLIFIQVNGEDLRNATHEQAIQAFRQAKDPIIVEVARRGPNTENGKSSGGPSGADLSRGPLPSEKRTVQSVATRSTGVQTDVTAEEATLVAMAAATLTTEDIRAALSLRHNGVPR